MEVPEGFVLIPGYTKYYINTEGKVYREGKFLKAKPNKKRWGYMYISLQERGLKVKNWLLHRLVAMTFIPNPYGLPQINHKDGNKSNNCIENLEWVSDKENKQHAILNGLSPQCTGDSQNNSPVTQYSLDGIFIKDYKSISEASRMTGIRICGISKCCKKLKYHYSAGGYIWRYLNDKTPFNHKSTVIRAVFKCDIDTTVICQYESITIASSENSISASDIVRVCKGKRRTAGGYVWKYKTP